MKGYKAFIKTENGKRCRGYNFENKEIHEIEGKLEVCENGFHFCEKLKDVFEYYDFDKKTVVIHEIEALGEVLTEDNKSVTGKIKIGRQLSNEEVFDNEDLQLKLVKENGFVIKFIENPSEKIKLEVIKQNGWAIEYIKNPSEELQLAAVKRNSWVIRHIENPSEKVQIAAVKENCWAIRYIKNPSEEVQLVAVKQNSFAIEYIKNPSEKVQIEAVKQNSNAIKYI